MSNYSHVNSIQCYCSNSSSVCEFCDIATINRCGKLSWYFGSELSFTIIAFNRLPALPFRKQRKMVWNVDENSRKLHRERMNSKKYYCVRATNNGLKHMRIPLILWVRAKWKAKCVRFFLCYHCSESYIFFLFPLTNKWLLLRCISSSTIAFNTIPIKDLFDIFSHNKDVECKHTFFFEFRRIRE